MYEMFVNFGKIYYMIHLWDLVPCKHSIFQQVECLVLDVNVWPNTTNNSLEWNGVCQFCYFQFELMQSDWKSTFLKMVGLVCVSILLLSLWVDAKWLKVHIIAFPNPNHNCFIFLICEHILWPLLFFILFSHLGELKGMWLVCAKIG